MRTLAFVAAFAVLAGATAVQAQNTPPERPAQAGRGMRGGGRGGGAMMDRVLLKGITLTDAQKASLDTLRKAEHDKMQAAGSDQGRTDFEAIRTARQQGDTATANRLMTEQRAKMDARRDEQTAAIRALLTSDQTTQFDANVAELKQRASEMGPGGRGGRGRRGAPTPPIKP